MKFNFPLQLFKIYKSRNTVGATSAASTLADMSTNTNTSLLKVEFYCPLYAFNYDELIN